MTTSPATCEEQLALSRNLYDELFQQTEQLRAERDKLQAERATLTFAGRTIKEWLDLERDYWRLGGSR